MSSNDPGQLVKVTTSVDFIEEQSDSYQNRFVFSYTITIENNSDKTLQLISRSWLITDANGHKVTVEGDGVVGQQPILNSGQRYRYSSGSIIKTPIGAMEGFYTMRDLDKNQYRVDIPVFGLAVPNMLN
ncbi:MULTISPECIES: Co2+/Mg2+ efflux protein ApaG [unclassified Thalassotalea]|uniref:Co2+/Mg2+ efflux protein ApaG n=1 Tax=unclassified Thalassotalea TaxID=2614972 RepID=UPI001081CF36|nr:MULTISPECIES: Co2+/Mg2+ efflux protein ApaG [unclassified Thalassotalea]NMP15824.1 Co2+/Mg2+ efflux protein ApaG [Thalassotalea sp. Y01]QBY04868.1 Co2+/Mg2+ efflux protein ApaG [Thalassotalea sp. HSM 43]